MQSEKREQKNFDQLKAKAETLQEQEFSKVTSVDEYEQKYNTLYNWEFLRKSCRQIS